MLASHWDPSEASVEKVGSIPDAPEAHKGGILICVLQSDTLY